MFRVTNVLSISNIIFDSLSLSQSIITNNLNTKIIDTIFTKCSFSGSDCRCIYHTGNSFHLERVLLQYISNSLSNIYLTSEFDKNISVVDYSDFSSYSTDRCFIFKTGGFLSMKRLNSSSTKGYYVISLDDMIKLNEFSYTNIFNCFAEDRLLSLDSEPTDKTFHPKYASDVNFIKSNAEYAIFVSSEYTLERFCIMDNDVTNTLSLYSAEKTIVHLVDFWTNNDFSTTGSGTVDTSGLVKGEKELLILINLPRSNGKSCEEFQKWPNILNLSVVLIEHKSE